VLLITWIFIVLPGVLFGLTTFNSKSLASKQPEHIIVPSEFSTNIFEEIAVNELVGIMHLQLHILHSIKKYFTLNNIGKFQFFQKNENTTN